MSVSKSVELSGVELSAVRGGRAIWALNVKSTDILVAAIEFGGSIRPPVLES